MQLVANSVQLVSGGNVMKEGDSTPLTFKLSDELGEIIDLTGASVLIKIANDKAVLLDKTATINADNTITISLTKNDVTGHGVMRLEFIVTYPSGEQEKFPADGWQQIRITPTLEDLNTSDAVAIVTVEKLQADVDEAVTKSTNAETTANTALSNSENTQTQLNQIVIEGDSSVEAAQARVDADGTAYTTLKERLDTEHTSVNSKLADLSKKTNVIINLANFANGDGTDETLKIQQAIDAIPSSGGIFIVPKTDMFYGISQGLQWVNKSNVSIISNNAEIKFLNGTLDVQYDAYPDFAKDSVFRFTTCNDILIEGLKLNGNISNRTANTTPNAGGVQESMNSGITLLGCENVAIQKCTITESMCDGINLYYNSLDVVNTNIKIDNCKINKNRRNNVSICAFDGVVLSDSLLEEAGAIQGISPMGGFIIEPDHIESGVGKNVIVEGCTVQNNQGEYGAYASGLGTENLKIINNNFIGNATHGLDLEEYPDYSNSKNTEVRGNVFKDHINGYGLRIDRKNCDNVSDNIFQNNQYGIACYLSDGLMITNNKFIKNWLGGLYSADPSYGFIKLFILGNIFEDNIDATGESWGGGYAFDGVPFGTSSTLLFDNNFMYSTPSATTKQKGARVTGTSNTRSRNNIAQNLFDNTLMVEGFAGGTGNDSFA